MTLHLPDDLAKALADQASAVGQEVEAYAVGRLRASLSQQQGSQQQGPNQQGLDEALRPVRGAFKRSGMTEDETVELFEQANHAMRRGE